MTTLASYSPGHSWRRSGSRESIYSIQGYETELVRDTTDTESESDREDVEYEPVTDVEDVDGELVIEDSSGLSDSDIISTKVIEVSVVNDDELQLADSEQTTLESSDSELDYHDYWLCANCRADNNDPTYRYCQKCFKVRKNFFPPRPKRKPKRIVTVADVPPIPSILSQDSGIDMLNSQELGPTEPVESDCVNSQNTATRKRRNSSIDSENDKNKRSKIYNTESETESDLDIDDVKPLYKSVSDPAVTVHNDLKPKNEIIETPEIDYKSETNEKVIYDKSDETCITCLSEPKSGVFVHGRIAHICCCYKCAVKVWRKTKRCPVCNSKVSNVLKAVVM